MKRSVIVLFLFLLLALPFALADNSTLNNSAGSSGTSESSKIDKAYSCLSGKVKTKCSSLSAEEQIFSLLTLGECSSNVASNSQNNECWPKSGCNIKATAQAVMALSKNNLDASKAIKWLLSQNSTPNDLIWYLQIDSSGQTSCKVDGHTIVIGEDKKINSGAGGCLSLSQNGYWLQISPTCFNKEFSISCDKDFLTNLLYQRRGSSTIYVPSEVSSASAEGTTIEKITLSCFKTGGVCDYEGGLWAVAALQSSGEDIQPFLSYLSALTENNQKFLPDSFLYSASKEQRYKDSLVSLQKSGKYWDVSGDKIFDTSIALRAFLLEDAPEETSAKQWLLEIQDSDGCWKGNIRNTASVLAFGWPKSSTVINPTPDQPECEDSNNFCVSETSCSEAGGKTLIGLHCTFPKVCCDKDVQLQTCADQEGTICSSDKVCTGGETIYEASDLTSGQSCCKGGTCQTSSTQNECEENSGTCKSSCSSSEDTKNFACDYSDEKCCKAKTTTSSGGSYWWIWVLVILILLAVLGIVFREKLQILWFQLKSRFGKGSAPIAGRPSMPPSNSSQAPFVRRILPPQMNTQRPRLPSPVAKPSAELDDVLKKLKEMGK